MKANENELNKVMSDLGTIRKEIGRLDSLNKTIDKEVDKIGNQIEHRIEVCEQTPEILDKAEIEFNQLTSILNKKDIPFFVFSILLQCGIQYIIKTFRDMTDKEIAKRTPFHNNERSNRFENKYYTSKEEIFSNSSTVNSSFKYCFIVSEMITFSVEEVLLLYNHHNQVMSMYSHVERSTSVIFSHPVKMPVASSTFVNTSTFTSFRFVQSLNIS